MGKRNLITAEQANLARLKLQEAFLTREPPEMSQRRQFFRLMPEIYLLRTQNKLTFEEIAQLLNECGLKLSASTVRVYYLKFYAELQDSLENESQDMIEKKEALRRAVDEIEFAEVSENFVEMLKNCGR